MKILHTINRLEPKDPNKLATPAGKRPLKICVVFDDDCSARGAEILIQHVASDYQCETQSFRFEELDPPGAGIAAARSAANTDILVLAIRDDRVFPSYVRLWLGLCLGLRAEGRDGALVALITRTEETNELDSSLLDYLETVTLIGGLAFFVRQQNFNHDFASIPATLAQRPQRRPDLSFFPLMRSPAGKSVKDGGRR
jgi:hypothetical protein